MLACHTSNCLLLLLLLRGIGKGGLRVKCKKFTHFLLKWDGRDEEEEHNKVGT
jgi:hypothetical protein